MTLKNLNFENLFKFGLLKEHIAKRDEIETHMITAQERLQDALLPNISKTGKFIGLYDTSHALS